jgi:hypothetical protein
MHAIAIGIPPDAPTNLTGTPTESGAILNWTDNSLNDTGFTVQRADDSLFTLGLMTWKLGQDVTTFTDTSGVAAMAYYYRVQANNVIGDTDLYPLPAIGFPNRSVDSGFSNVVTLTVLGIPPAAPTNLIADGRRNPLRAVLTWTDNSTDETGFNIQRAEDPAFTVITTFTVGPNVVTYTDSQVVAQTPYYYRVAAFNGPLNSAFTNVVTVGPPSLPPSGLTATRGNGNQVIIRWMDNSPDVPNPPNFNYETAFVIQIRTSAGGPWTAVNSVTGSRTTGPKIYTDRTSRPRGTYWYRIQANNMFGNSRSAPLQFTRN